MKVGLEKLENYKGIVVKNGYLLSLIVDILDRVEKKKVLMKLDLRWEYNNVRIKKGNK